MSGFLQGIASAGILAFIFWVLTRFNWPDIDAYLTYVTVPINYLYSLNSYFPVDTLFTIFGIVLSLEVALLIIKIMFWLASFFTGFRIQKDD